MTDYTDLINELVCYADNDQDFIEPQDSINTKAAEAIKTLVSERDLLNEWLDDARATANVICDQLRVPILIDAPKAITDLQAERDAAVVAPVTDNSGDAALDMTGDR